MEDWRLVGELMALGLSGFGETTCWVGNMDDGLMEVFHSLETTLVSIVKFTSW